LSGLYKPFPLFVYPAAAQDKEGNGRNTSHEENVIFIFEESRHQHSN
jgi:hypothetical protein